MNFIELRPLLERRKESSIHNIRVSFPKLTRKNGDTSYSLLIFLGIEIFNKLGLDENSRVKILINADNPRIIALEKATDSGFKIIKDKNSTTHYRVQATWKSFIPSQKEIRIHEVDFEFKKNRVIVHL